MPCRHPSPSHWWCKCFRAPRELREGESIGPYRPQACKPCLPERFPARVQRRWIGCLLAPHEVGAKERDMKELSPTSAAEAVAVFRHGIIGSLTQAQLERGQ